MAECRLGRVTAEDTFSYICGRCGQAHSGSPDLGFDAPYHYNVLDADERTRIARLTSDTCVINDEGFFVRGLLEIPVHGRAETFGLGVWVSLSRKSFARYEELYESIDRTDEGFFGWLCNTVPGYPDTLHLKTNVHLRPHPLRPRIELQLSDHPLAIDQRNGISIARMQEVFEANEHAA